MSENIRVSGGGVLRPASILLILVAIAAWCSNPDEAHFQRWLQRQLANPADTALEKLSVRAVAKLALAAADWERTNYGFCSVVTFHDAPSVRFLGVCGTWFPLGTDA